MYFFEPKVHHVNKDLFLSANMFSPLITALRILGVGVYVIFDTPRPLILSVRMIDPPLVCISRPKLKLQRHSFYS
jgi:hypothetical protein